MRAATPSCGLTRSWDHLLRQEQRLKPYTIKGGVDSTSVEGAANIIYGFPNLQVDLHSPKIGVPVQWWRSVGHSHTGFSVEAFFDEVAHGNDGHGIYGMRCDTCHQITNLPGAHMPPGNPKWGLPAPGTQNG